MSLVLDASITLARVFDDERTPAVDAVFVQIADLGAHVPDLWRIETANALNIAVRRKRINLDDRKKILVELNSLPLNFDLESPHYCWTETLQLADRHGLTVYDATYLELALRLALPLATLDRELRAAAEAESFPLLGL